MLSKSLPRTVLVLCCLLADAAAAATSADNIACEQKLQTEWPTKPPIVGISSKSSAASYDSVIGGLMAKYQIPGGAVAVTRSGQLVLARGYGVSDQLGHQPTHPAQLFRIASLSKQITATAILQLVQEGKLGLETSAFSYLPALQPLPGLTRNAQLAQITIRHLLNHTGGWNRDHDRIGDPMFPSQIIAMALREEGPASATDTIRFMLSVPPTYAPGSTYCYSNFGYAVLGAIIEQVTGSTYESYVKAHVLGPRGITDMTIGGSLQSQALPEEVTYLDYPNAAPAASEFPGAPEMVPAPYGSFNMQALAAHGGWLASPIDLLRFVAGIDKYVPPLMLVSNSSLAQMLANPNVPSCNANGSTSPASSASWYGFGFSVNRSGNYWHSGALPGTATEDVIANNKFAFAAFFNRRPRDGGAFADDLDAALWTAFNGVQTWAAEDQLDQYGAFSDWMIPAAYVARVSTSDKAGSYPARVEGRLRGAITEYRAAFVPRHAGARTQTGAGLDCVAYSTAARNNEQAGLELTSLQTFTDGFGRVSYQATWKSF